MIKGNLKQAIKYENEALESFKYFGEIEKISTLQNLLPNIYKALNYDNEAYKFFKRSLNLAKKMISIANFDIGVLLSEMEQWKESEKYVIESSELSRELEDIEGVAFAKNDLTNIYLEKVLYRVKEIKLGKSALQILKSLYYLCDDDKHLKKALEFFKKLYFFEKYP